MTESEKIPGAVPNEFKFYPLMIVVNPEVAELMKSNESKDLMKAVTRACERWKAFFDRECKGVAAYLFDEVDPDHQSTKFRHMVLHRALDELLACYIEETGMRERTTSILQTPIREFMEWSHQMTIEATCEEKNAKTDSTD